MGKNAPPFSSTNGSRHFFYTHNGAKEAPYGYFSWVRQRDTATPWVQFYDTDPLIRHLINGGPCTYNVPAATLCLVTFILATPTEIVCGRGVLAAAAAGAARKSRIKNSGISCGSPCCSASCTSDHVPVLFYFNMNKN